MGSTSDQRLYPGSLTAGRWMWCAVIFIAPGDKDQRMRNLMEWISTPRSDTCACYQIPTCSTLYQGYTDALYWCTEFAPRIHCIRTNVIACRCRFKSLNQTSVCRCWDRVRYSTTAATWVLFRQQEAAAFSYFQEQPHLKGTRQVLWVHTFNDKHNWWQPAWHWMVLFLLTHWSKSTLWRRELIGGASTHEFCIGRPALSEPQLLSIIWVVYIFVQLSTSPCVFTSCMQSVFGPRLSHLSKEV